MVSVLHATVLVRVVLAAHQIVNVSVLQVTNSKGWSMEVTVICAMLLIATHVLVKIYVHHVITVSKNLIILVKRVDLF